jgi:stage II sporulation protein D
MRRLLLLTALLTLSVPATADAATRWVVDGGGWGHGLGMSQYGAYGQALEGRGYRKILGHYYRNTTMGQASGRVRVLLLASVGSSTFGGANKVGSKSINPNRNYIVRRVGGRIVVKTPRGKRIARSSGTLRVTGPNGLVTVAGKGSYRDAIVYRPGLSGGVTAVNHVELENYIRGVVPNESPASWPIEALKAQAVAARSYALGTNSNNPVFDHYDTVASQVYGGYSSENVRTNRAVARTRGEVLRSNGRVIVAYFHSTSGGYTENNENVWGGSPIPYIRGVRDPWDRHSPYHRWKVRYSPRSLGSAMGVGRLRSVQVHKRGVSGRIVRATFRGTGGRNRVSGYDGIRGRLGLRDIPRTFKRITSRGSTARAAVAGLGSRVLARDVSGSIAPAAPGARVRVERRTGDGWKRVAQGRLVRSGKYRIPVEVAGLYRVITAGYAGPAVRVR